MALKDIVNDEVERVTGEVVKNTLKKHTTGLVRDPSPDGIRRLTDGFIEQDIGSAIRSTTDQVVKPALKNLFFDGLVSVLERMFFGIGRQNQQRTNYSNSLVRTHTASGTNYSRTSITKPAVQAPENPPSKLDWRNIVFEDGVDPVTGRRISGRVAAQEFLDDLKGSLFEHGSVSVMEVYESMTAGDDSTPIPGDFTSTYFGWTGTELDAAFIKPLGGTRFRVVLPKPKELK